MSCAKVHSRTHRQRHVVGVGRKPIRRILSAPERGLIQPAEKRQGSRLVAGTNHVETDVAAGKHTLVQRHYATSLQPVGP
jgi:hypothetical protein